MENNIKLKNEQPCGYSCCCDTHNKNEHYDHEYHKHKHEHHEHNHKHVHNHDHEHSNSGSCACASSGCGCEHNHSSSKAMIFQFGISALFFVLGLLIIFLKKDFILFDLTNFPIKISIILFFISWIFAGYKVVITSLKNILNGKLFDENFLMTVATIGAFIIGEWVEGAAVMLFYNLGELVQHSAVEKSRRSIVDLMDLRPDFARILLNEYNQQIEKMVSPEQVDIGSLVIVHAGEKIPLDGIIKEGIAELDTSSMTGESLPRSAEEGTEVLAGFVNLTGKIIVETTKKLEDTTASKMLDLIEKAQDRKAKVERFITSFARIYTPIVTIGAVLLSVLPPLFNWLLFSTPIIGWSSFSPWVARGLVFLVISCPCAFVISVPLGYFGGIGGAAKKGILIKGADYIDVLSKADGVVFDKTGTLTKGILKVMALIPHRQNNYEDSKKNIELKGVSKEAMTDSDKYSILKFAYLAEKNSHHPIAKAIVECAGINLMKQEYEDLQKTELENYTEKAGMGISVDYNGETILAGKKDFICKKLNIQIPDLGEEIGGTQVFISYEKKYLGFIILTDSLKDNSVLAIENLKKLNISHIEMMTGDTEVSAKHTALELGLTHYKALLLPNQKVSNFERISGQVKASNKKNTIVFVGDGINDAPVLARSDAGIAMGGIGSDAAIEAADVVLMTDDPNLVPTAIKHSRYTKKIVWENIAFAFIIKIGFLSLGALGIVGLWSAVFADVGVSLLAVLNSLRVRI